MLQKLYLTFKTEKLRSPKDNLLLKYKLRLDQTRQTSLTEERGLKFFSDLWFWAAAFMNWFDEIRELRNESKVQKLD